MNLKPNFSKLNGLIPCLVQDAQSDKVLMVAFMNEEAWEKTKAEKRATFFSRTRNRLWTKGETSGNFLEVVEMILDCDQDAVLLKVRAEGSVCHTGQDTCFAELNETRGLGFLERIIEDRRANPRANSYTSRLLSSDIQVVAQKVGEEAVELILEAKGGTQERFLNEAADLMYHFLVLLSAKGTSLADVSKVLAARQHKGK